MNRRTFLAAVAAIVALPKTLFARTKDRFRGHALLGTGERHYRPLSPAIQPPVFYPPTTKVMAIAEERVHAGDLLVWTSHYQSTDPAVRLLVDPQTWAYGTVRKVRHPERPSGVADNDANAQCRVLVHGEGVYLTVATRMGDGERAFQEALDEAFKRSLTMSDEELMRRHVEALRDLLP